MLNSAEEFVYLRNSENPEEYRRAAWEEAPFSVWYEIIQNYPDMKEWVAHNKTIPDEIIELLSEDDDEKVRYMIAMKRKIKLNIFKKLSKDKNDTVRMQIVMNPKCPREILESMIDDNWVDIREEVNKKLNKNM